MSNAQPLDDDWLSTDPLDMCIDGGILARGKKSGGKDNILLSKKYSSHFIWGQLVVWFKQTVNDPAASLSADRRGTLSLPDIESCYGSGRAKYHAKVILVHICSLLVAFVL